MGKKCPCGLSWPAHRPAKRHDYPPGTFLGFRLFIWDGNPHEWNLRQDGGSFSGRNGRLHGRAWHHSGFADHAWFLHDWRQGGGSGKSAGAFGPGTRQGCHRLKRRSAYQGAAWQAFAGKTGHSPVGRAYQLPGCRAYCLAETVSDRLWECLYSDFPRHSFLKQRCQPDLPYGQSGIEPLRGRLR